MTDQTTPSSPDATDPTPGTQAQPDDGIQTNEDLAAQVLAQAESLTVPELADSESGAAGKLALLSDVDLNVKIELGRTQMLVEDVLRLGEGSIVELDKLAGDPVDVYVNDRHVARGEVLVLSDNFCIRISEIVADLAEQAALEAGRQDNATN